MPALTNPAEGHQTITELSQHHLNPSPAHLSFAIPKAARSPNIKLLLAHPAHSLAPASSSPPHHYHPGRLLVLSRGNRHQLNLRGTTDATATGGTCPPTAGSKGTGSTGLCFPPPQHCCSWSTQNLHPWGTALLGFHGAEHPHAWHCPAWSLRGSSPS